MNAKLFLVGLLLLGCMAPVPAENALPPPSAGDLLPPATRNLVVPGTRLDYDALEQALAEGPREEITTLLDLVHEFAACTGQQLLMDIDAQGQLASIMLPLLAGTEVPAAEVYPFVEAILFHHGVFIAPVKGGQVSMLGIYPADVGRGGNRRTTNWVGVAEEDLPQYAEHAALLIETVVHLPNTEVRQLCTSMRTMLSDQNTQLMVPVGEHAVLIRGTGREIARIVRMLKTIDEAEAKPQAETPVPTDLPGQKR